MLHQNIISDDKSLVPQGMLVIKEHLFELAGSKIRFYSRKPSMQESAY